MTGRPPADGRGARTVRVDPHVHTAASYDGTTTPENLLEAAERAGLDGVVVTDHDTVRGARVVADRAAAYDVTAVVGCEVSTADGHLLALGVDDAPAPDRPLRATAEEVRESGGAAVVPHPFQRSRHGARASAIEGVDGVEVYNAHTVVSVRNRQAAAFAERRGLPSFGGSDAHRAANVGRAATEVRVPADAPLTPETVVEAMRAGRTAAVGRRTSTWGYLTKLVGTARLRTPSFR